VSTGVSAPDLSHHLAVLEGAGLVTITKGYVGRRPRTWAELTVLGGQALEGEIEVLRSLVRFADTAGADAQATLGAIS
jgi:DNA-binding transcriptional ArsR family regulator